MDSDTRSPPAPPAWRKRLDGARAMTRRPAVRRVLTIIKYALFVAVVAILIRRLGAIGWSEVIANLPQTPWFYVIFVARYFALPLSEIPAYEIVWKQPLRRHFSAFLRKRVYNFAVMGYSGEAFFAMWARRTLNLSDREIVHGVKDNNIVSALVSNLATALVVAALFISGDFARGVRRVPGGEALFAIAFASAALLAGAAILYRKSLMSLRRGQTRRLVAINGARMTVVMALQAALYASVIPGAPLGAWAMFVALQLVLTRIPFVPNPDIVFLTAALSLAETIEAPAAQVAGMLVAEAGLSQIFNAVLFLATAHLAFARPAAEARPGAPPT